MSNTKFKMSCMGSFFMDRTCEMCKNVSPEGHSNCKELRDLNCNQDRCSKSYSVVREEDGTDPYYGFDSSDKVTYWMCSLNGKDDEVRCRPTVDCLKYCKR